MGEFALGFVTLNAAHRASVMTPYPDAPPTVPRPLTPRDQESLILRALECDEATHVDVVRALLPGRIVPSAAELTATLDFYAQGGLVTRLPGRRYRLNCTGSLPDTAFAGTRRGYREDARAAREAKAREAIEARAAKAAREHKARLAAARASWKAAWKAAGEDAVSSVRTADEQTPWPVVWAEMMTAKAAGDEAGAEEAKARLTRATAKAAEAHSRMRGRNAAT